MRTTVERLRQVPSLLVLPKVASLFPAGARGKGLVANCKVQTADREAITANYSPPNPGNLGARRLAVEGGVSGVALREIFRIPKPQLQNAYRYLRLQAFVSS